MNRLILGALLAATASVPLLAASPDSARPAPEEMKKVRVIMRDAASDQAITRAEVGQIVAAQFAARDVNKDGALAGDELAGKYRIMRMAKAGMNGEWKEMGDKDVEFHIEKMGDGPGPEGPMRGAMPLPDPKIAFDRMDTNKDGMISRDEFAKGREVRFERIIERRGGGHDMAAMHGKHGGPGMMRMRPMGGLHIGPDADANKDGKVTLAEAQANAAAHFATRDTNKDGKLSGDELGRPHMMVRTREKVAG